MQADGGSIPGDIATVQGAMADRRQPRRWNVRNFLLFLWIFLAVALLVGSWSLSTPLGASPDAPSNVNQAAAAVRGQLDNAQVISPFGKVGVVRIPKWASNEQPECFYLRSSVPAGCSPSIGTNTRTVQAFTQFGHYPPLYYLIVGVPTLLAIGSGALYGMQLTGALVDAAFIALGLFLLARYHPRRLPLLGALVALAPMVLFVGAVVNSSGLETAAAFAAWCGGLCVVTRKTVPLALAILTAFAFFFLILSRPLSPVNAVVILVVLGVTGGWSRTRELLHDPNVRLIWASAVVATIVAGVSLALIGSPTLLGAGVKPPLSLAGSVWLTLRHTGGRLGQLIGNFGWLDTPVPSGVIAIWTSAVVGLLAYGAVASRVGRRALPLLALAILAMPVVFESPRVNTVGPYWQARYWLPLAVGLPLVATSIVPVKRIAKAVPPMVQLVGSVVAGTALAVAQIAAFLTALHRYETGLGAKPGTPVVWTPPGGTTLVVSLFVAGEILLVGLVAWRYLEKKGSPVPLAQPT